jgi:hypothetical protein
LLAGGRCYVAFISDNSGFKRPLFLEEGGREEKTGEDGSSRDKKKKKKNLHLACKHHTSTPFFLRNIKKKKFVFKCNVFIN